MTRTTLDTGMCDDHGPEAVKVARADLPNRIRVGDLLTDITEPTGHVYRDPRDPSKAARFLVTAIDADGTTHLKWVRS